MTRQQLADLLEIETDRLHDKYAEQYEALFKQELARFNLSRHRVYIKYQTLMVGGAHWTELYPGTPVIDAIWKIGNDLQRLPWLARKLDGKILYERKS